MSLRMLLSACLGLILGAACTQTLTIVEPPLSDGGTPEDAGTTTPDAGSTPDAGASDPDRARINHDFGMIPMRANEEITPCISWTLNNAEPIYVEAVTLSNGGWFHHSNWFVVPESQYRGPDGLWNCNERGFSEVGAAVAGTVLFAQSTQAQVETQSLGEGVVIKIPPRHTVVGSLHLLNLTPRPQLSQLIMSLDLLRPSRVDTVVAPFRLLYGDLEITPQSQSRFTSECNLAETVEGPFEMKLYYMLPHYHALGNYFRVELVSDDDRNGQVILELDGFNAQPNGKLFDPPLDLDGITGFKFTCGYDNPRDDTVRWGIGDQEMCEALGLASSATLYDARNAEGNTFVGEVDGVRMNEGPCEVTALPKNTAQTPPTEEEKARPFYVPPSDPEDMETPPVVGCQEPEELPDVSDAARLSVVQEEVLVPSCTFSSCHDGTNPAAGLDLLSAGLHARLMAHQVLGNTDRPLIAPGDPEGSWLYHRVSRCAPTDRDGNEVGRMPYGSSMLIDTDALALIHDWIAAGAQDD